jgi:hypothetical protein
LNGGKIPQRFAVSRLKLQASTEMFEAFFFFCGKIEKAVGKYASDYACLPVGRVVCYRNQYP